MCSHETLQSYSLLVKIQQLAQKCNPSCILHVGLNLDWHDSSTSLFWVKQQHQSLSSLFLLYRARLTILVFLALADESRGLLMWAVASTISLAPAWLALPQGIGLTSTSTSSTDPPAILMVPFLKLGSTIILSMWFWAFKGNPRVWWPHPLEPSHPFTTVINLRWHCPELGWVSSVEMTVSYLSWGYHCYS